MHSEERWIAGDFTTDMSISVVLSECLYLWARGSTERGGGVARRLHECTIPNNRLMVESHVCVEYNVNHSKSSTGHNVNSRQTDYSCAAALVFAHHVKAARPSGDGHMNRL